MEQSTALLLPLTQSPQHHLPLPTFRIHHLLPPHPSPPTFTIFTSYLHHPIQMSLAFDYHSLWPVSVNCLLRWPRSPPEGCEARLPCLPLVRIAAIICYLHCWPESPGRCFSPRWGSRDPYQQPWPLMTARVNNPSWLPAGPLARLVLDEQAVLTASESVNSESLEGVPCLEIKWSFCFQQEWMEQVSTWKWLHQGAWRPCTSLRGLCGQSSIMVNVDRSRTPVILPEWGHRSFVRSHYQALPHSRGSFSSPPVFWGGVRLPSPLSTLHPQPPPLGSSYSQCDCLDAAWNRPLGNRASWLICRHLRSAVLVSSFGTRGKGSWQELFLSL